MTDHDHKDLIGELRALLGKAFRLPWTAETWTVECPGEDDENGEDCGYDHRVETILSPEEYPDGQVVAQVNEDGSIHTPGLKDFATANSALIAGAVNTLPDLLRVVEAARAMVTVCQYPCGNPRGCGNCNALRVALEALDR